MIIYQSRRLANVFGRPLDQLTASDVVAAVATNPREEEDLDFKEKAYATDKAEQVRREFAKDVAAFANAQGGLILIGVEEKNGVAVNSKPVDCSDSTLRSLRQAIAGLIYPMPLFGVDALTLPDCPTEGYILVTIPRSKDAPHAVRWDNNDPKPLVYPRRLGTQTIFLSENEIASAYRDRFAAARQQVNELSRVQEDGIRTLSDQKGWLCLTLVPNSTADVHLNHTSTGAYYGWARSIRSLTPGMGPFENGRLDVTPRARRLALMSEGSSWPARADDNYAELHTNGSGFVASPIFDIKEEITKGYSFGLNTHSPIQDELSSAHPGIRAGTRLLDSFPTGEQTLSLLDTLRSGREHLMAVRLLLTNLFQAFGLVEVPQIDERGELRKPFWSQARRADLEAWAKINNTRLHEDALGQ